MHQTERLLHSLALCVLLSILGNAPQLSAAESWDFFESPKKSKAPKVEIYVASWCPYCKKLERYLTDNQIRYVRHDIEESSAAAARHKSLGGGGVPVIVIGSKTIRGFNESALQEALQELQPAGGDRRSDRSTAF